jgi:hypothetical protein
MKGFLRLSLVPKFLPPLVMPFYWIFLLCFYPFYCLVYFFVWVFSPRKDDNSRLRPYLVKSSKVKRDLTPEKNPEDPKKPEARKDA